MRRGTATYFREGGKWENLPADGSPEKKPFANNLLVPSARQVEFLPAMRYWPIASAVSVPKAMCNLYSITTKRPSLRCFASSIAMSATSHRCRKLQS